MKNTWVKKIICFVMLAAFCVTNIAPSYAQSVTQLPQPGVMVNISPTFDPMSLKGLKIDPKDPLRFEFILDKGDETSATSEVASRLIRYFLASLTVPEKDLWVNLSPYEKDRIIPDAFGLTEMGRDLLSQDYILKQITASLIYPEGETGKKFWAEVYQQTYDKYGTTDVPVDTFNKVWIVPAKAVVYENAKAGIAYVVESKLKVMLESDYVSMENSVVKVTADVSETQDMARKIIAKIVIPLLEKEVNEGANFTRLRQVYSSLILAAWYKRKIKDSLLSSVYVDQNKVKGVNIQDPKEAEEIWGQYVEAFKKGAYNYIKEERDEYTDELIPRKYFSGGIVLECDMAMISAADLGNLIKTVPALVKRLTNYIKLSVGLRPVDSSDESRAFDKYISQDQYLKEFRNEPLVKIFTPEIREALMQDSALRPVFMLVLDEQSGQVGPLQGADMQELEQIGGMEMINAYSGFLVGNAAVANEEIKKGHRIIVGVTDRYTDKTLMRGVQVANRRQVYFPLSDGTWLGVKGTGDLLKQDVSTTYIVDKHNERVLGLASEEEARDAKNMRETIKGSEFRAVQFLGYRSLHVLTDGAGGLIQTMNASLIDGQEPVMIFNRVFSPHRFVKLPQLLQDDPGLLKLHANIVRAFENNGMKAPATPGRMIMDMVNQFAANAAFKHNNHYIKETFHLQDMLFSGEEADNEEWWTYEQMLEKTSKDRDALVMPYTLHFLQKYRFNFSELSFCFILMNWLVEGGLFSKESKIDMPGSPVQMLSDFWDNYLSKLSDDNLKVWLDEYDVIEFGQQERVVVRPLQAVFAHQGLDRFHPNPSGKIDRDKFEVLLMLQTMLEKKAAQRGISHPFADIDTHRPVTPKVLLSDQYLVPGYRAPQEGDRSFGNYKYPSVDKKLILKTANEVMQSSSSLKAVVGLPEASKDENIELPKALKDKIVEYAMGFKTVQEVFIEIKEDFPRAADHEDTLKQTLAAVRVWGKYNLNYSIEAFLEFILFNPSIDQGNLPPNVSEIFGMVLEEIKQLMEHDEKVSDEVLAELNTVDLGDPQTVKEVVFEEGKKDSSEATKGGIDLNPVDGMLQLQNSGDAIQIHIDPVQLQLLQGAQGFTPIITSTQPLTDLPVFLGIK